MKQLPVKKHIDSAVAVALMSDSPDMQVVEELKDLMSTLLQSANSVQKMINVMEGSMARRSKV